jgi:hypothetical protein
MTSSSYMELLEEYERATSPTGVPYYRPRNEFRNVEVVAPDNESRQPPPRLQFQAPPPLAPEPTMEDRLSPFLEPLRERLEAAESAYMAAEEASRRDSMRLDLDRAAASVRNLSTDLQPPRKPLDPKAAFKMNDRDWEAHKEAIRNGEHE